MRSTLIISLLIFITSLEIHGQVQRSNELYYGQFKGVIDEDNSATLNLIRSFEKVSGNYYLTPTADNKKNNQPPNSFSGKVNNDSISMKHFGSEEPFYEGLISSSELIGQWNLMDKSPVSTVFKNQQQPGSLDFDVSYLHSEQVLTTDLPNSPTASLELTLLYPKNHEENTALTDSIIQHIQTAFYGQKTLAQHPDSLLINLEREYFKNYAKQNEQWLKNGGHSFSWEKLINMGITYNANYLLCFDLEKYAYTGGAHGMSHITYQIINLYNGTTLSYNDLFEVGSDTILTNLLTQRLKDDNDIPQDSTLKSAGFFVDHVSPNHNMYLNAAGIGFLYNSYEIAPYSFGSTQIFVPYNNLLDLLKKDSPLQPLIKTHTALK